MDPAHRCLRPDDQALQLTRPLDRHFLHHSPSKLDTEDILLISSSKAKDSMAAKVAAMQA
jgi:hypothetical protein